MALTLVNLIDTFDEWRIKTNDISLAVGDLATLGTTNKSSAVEEKTNHLPIFFLNKYYSLLKYIFCFKASDKVIAAAILILRDLAFLLNGIFNLSYELLCTSLGTPALSLPKSKVSLALNLKL